jgi:hypothetical protein
LGKATVIDSLLITWPDLRIQVLTDLEVDQTMVLRNEDAVEREESPGAEPETLFTPLRDPVPVFIQHRENDYNDFLKQILLPWKLSTQGPSLAVEDVNGDGLEDLFLGGAKGFPGQLFLQERDGTFTSWSRACFEADTAFEDVGALFADVDGDLDPDLYVVSGGNEFAPEAKELQDRLYLNDGKGNFSSSVDRLPSMLTSGSCVEAADMDGDGDLDLFVGGRLSPENYPLAPRSYLLKNDGTGKFRDVTEELNPELLRPGMVSDALWTDVNQDEQADLILVGEWMPVRIFLNKGTAFEELTGQEWMNRSEGWWNSIEEGDFDQDGDSDYILGNTGKNFQIKPTVDEPASMYASDFDNNGSLDGVMCYYIKGRNAPLYSKLDLDAQLSILASKYPDHQSFANETIGDIFPEKVLDKALKLKVTNASSCYMENQGQGEFALSELPLAAQLSPIYAIQSADYNRDGKLDLLLAGNFLGSRLKFGHLDANRGVVLLGNGDGSFESLPQDQSGLFLEGEIRDMEQLELSTGQEILIFAPNNGILQFYGIKE